ncbi:MAG: DUF1549 and DUF1553 domain-containing protein [Planctomycetota bacterium]|nr:DUF1549 and DUF1553 domain-containing protein [Planctomycetota bacterium]
MSNHSRTRLFSGRILASCAIISLMLALPALGQETVEFPGLGPRGALQQIRFESGPQQELVLQGPNSRGQLVVSGDYDSGQVHDLTVEVSYTVSPEGLVDVSKDGFVTPRADGECDVTATTGDGKKAVVHVTVESYSDPLPINFSSEIVPVFTKLGCNTGACHGKSGGQNGFKLSLLGFYPDEDYEWLVKEHRGRRIFPAAPEYSLLLTKPANKLPHGGGRRLDEEGHEWQLLVRWIEQGMPYGQEEDPVVTGIEVVPAVRDMNRNTEQQVRVLASYSDGTIRDVTRMATYESNDSEMANAEVDGRISVFERPGSAAVMIRFQGQVTVFRAHIPLGIEVTELPAEKNYVDQHVFGKLKRLGIPPSELSSDAVFIRRVFLDVIGRLPTAEQARSFVADKDPAKRDKLVDFLLEHPGYGDYFSNKWVMILRNQRINNNTAVTYRFHDWVRRAFQQNMPYDRFVRNMLVASGDVEIHPPVSWYLQVNTATEQMEDTAQLFLGLRIQCARCHHHPFEQWSQDDYYGFQAFFSQVGLKPSRGGVPNGSIFHKGALATARNPRTNGDRKPTGLGGEELDIPAYEDPRHQLVDWMAEPGNPFFAKSLVNRYWKHFFGRGIVDPEDDMRVTNPPSNPELLDALAGSFIANKFDLKRLVRDICTSSAYQLSSEPNEYNGDDKQNFSSFYPRRLNAEPLYDAINQVANSTVAFSGMPAGTRAVQLPDSGFTDYFLMVFGKPQAASACECERSDDANLAQSLHLLNSTDIQGKLAAGGGRPALLAADEEKSEEEKVDELYYWAFSRPAKDSEKKLIFEFLAGQPNKKQAFEDVLWALFNTKEFLFIR